MANVKLLDLNQINYSNLLDAYKGRRSGIKGQIFEGWTKVGRCEMVAKEIFEQLKHLKPESDSEVAKKQRAYAQVLMNDVEPDLGASNLSAMVDVRSDSLEAFFKLLAQTQDLETRSVLYLLGKKTSGVQLVNKNGQNHGAPIEGYANILTMDYSTVQACLNELANLERDVKEIPLKTLKALAFDRETLRPNIALAKRQLELRMERLRVMADELPMELCKFNRAARNAKTPRDKATVEGALTKLKESLDAVETLYKKKNFEERAALKSTLDVLAATGRCSRTKKGRLDDFQESRVAFKDFVLATGGIIVTAAASQAATALGAGELVALASTAAAAALSPLALVGGLATLGVVNYRRGGILAEWLSGE